MSRAFAGVSIRVRVFILAAFAIEDLLGNLHLLLVDFGHLVRHVVVNKHLTQLPGLLLLFLLFNILSFFVFLFFL